MSFDFDYVLVDYSDETVIIIVGGEYYEYPLEEVEHIVEGAEKEGVNVIEKNKPAEYSDWDWERGEEDRRYDSYDEW